MGDVGAAAAAKAENARLREHWVEGILTVLLSLTTLLSAWCGYQSARWSGQQARNYAKAAAARTESAKFANQASVQITLDSNLFSQYADAFNRGDRRLADFFYRRFPPVLRKATDAWWATKPLGNPRAPVSPFRMPDYQLEETIKSEQLAKTANDKAEEAGLDNQRSDSYVLLTVSMAAVLFLSGIITQFQRRRMKLAILILAMAAFTVSVIKMLTLPVR